MFLFLNIRKPKSRSVEELDEFSGYHSKSLNTDSRSALSDSKSHWKNGTWELRKQSSSSLGSTGQFSKYWMASMCKELC